MRIWTSFFLILALCSAPVSAMLLDPKLISSKKSKWYCHLDEYEGEQYYDIKYRDKTIFRSLKRILPAWNRIVLRAQEEGSYLYLPHIDADVFIVDQGEFSALRIVNMTLFDPEQVNLREDTPLARPKSYTVELVLNDCSKQSAYGRSKKISKKLFLALSGARFKAQKQGASLAIDMGLFERKKGAKIDFDDFIRVMKKSVTN